MQIMKGPFIHSKKILQCRFSITEFKAIIVITNIKSESQLSSKVQLRAMFVFMTFHDPTGYLLSITVSLELQNPL